MGKKLKVIDVNESGNVRKTEMSLEEKRRRRQRQRERQLALKKRRRQRLFGLAAAGAVIVVLLAVVFNLDFELVGSKFFKGSISAVAALIGDTDKNKEWKPELLYEISFEEFFEKNKPRVFEDDEVYDRLKQLAKEYPELKEIYEKRESYPVKLLASLCNNPEMHEYVKGYLSYQNGDTSVAGTAELTEAEKEQKYPLFLQWDKRWGYQEYADFNIAISGCGPTALAMAAVALTDDETVTPSRVAKFSMNSGYYVPGTGTAWKLMSEGCERFGLKAEEVPLDEEVMKKRLDEGKVMICSVREGDFTSMGHFIMIYGYNVRGFFVNDPNSIYRSSKLWTYDELKGQIRILWAFEEK